VFAYAHDKLTGVAIFSVDLLEKSVGRRATGTSLGREEFHEYRAMSRLRIIALRWVDGRAESAMMPAPRAAAMDEAE
jgi:hypothetical protein